MKTLLYGMLILLFGAMMASCKKEVTPKLFVTVVDSTGARMANVNVIVHPCYFNQETCDTAKLNPAFHKEKLSNSSGMVEYEFPHSAVLDLVGFSALLTSSNDTTGFLFGQTVISLETKELKKDEKNEYEVTLVVDKPF
jgi:hypothetical protein